MKLVQCSNGHYYDNAKYSDCPYCGNDSKKSEVTVPLSGNALRSPGVTVPLNQSGYAQKEQPAVQQTTVQMPAADISVAQKSEVQTPIVQQPQVQPSVIQMPSPEPPSARESTPREIASEKWRPSQPGTVTWRMSQSAAAGWSAPADNNRTVSYYSRTIGAEPVVGWLVAIEGNYFGESFCLKTGRNFIGRSSEMDVSLSMDHSVSRDRHATVIYEPKAKKFIAQPGDSRELFYINDEVVLNNITMNAYDVLTVGETKLLFIPLCGEQFNWEDIQKEKV